jgi:hypothetical protein
MKAPFRLGRKQKRAVLDSEGNEIVIFPKGREEYAELYVEFLNQKFKVEADEDFYLAYVVNENKELEEIKIPIF